MIEILIDNEVKKIDDNLTIGVWQKIYKEQQKYLKDNLQLLSLFLDEPVEKLESLPKNQVEFILTYVTDILTRKTNTELVEVFEFNGVKYGLENDWGNLAWGAWQDFEILSAENIEENIHHIMAVMYRPVVWEGKGKYKIQKYSSADIKERMEDFKDLPLYYWMGASTFFLRIVELYITDLKTSLSMTNKMNRLKIQGWKILPKFLQKKLPLASILGSHSQSQMKILPSSNR
jgi:hypothetical protein